jgi:peroxiredoxin
MTLLESLNLPLGTGITDFDLEGSDGKRYSLRSFENAKVLVIVFMCNHCPYVQAVWKRLVDLQAKYADREVQFVGINPNKNPEYEEETLEKMAEYSAKYSMNFPYLMDETQEVAKAYKAQCTPDIYVYDGARKLAYHGRIDDSWKDGSKVTKKELDEAISALLSGKNPSEQQYPSMGCSIKWRN